MRALSIGIFLFCLSVLDEICDSLLEEVGNDIKEDTSKREYVCEPRVLFLAGLFLRSKKLQNGKGRRWRCASRGFRDALQRTLSFLIPAAVRP